MVFVFLEKIDLSLLENICCLQMIYAMKVQSNITLQNGKEDEWTIPCILRAESFLSQMPVFKSQVIISFKRGFIALAPLPRNRNKQSLRRKKR